jgi:hypothetical protein
MRKILIIIMFLWISIFSSARAEDVDLGGYVLTDWRVRTSDGQLLWNENRLNLEIDASPTGNAHVFAQVWVRGFGGTMAKSTADLMGHDKRKSNPWDLILREAYVDLYEFLSPNLDLRIGRQRIAWGTADKINPTDNLNPDDLEDIWDFGRHIPTTSMLATYYWDEVTIYGVFVPSFTPAALPPPDWAAALTGSLPALGGDVMPSMVSDELDLPGRSLKEQASAAIKVSRAVFNYDLSVSYYTGRSDFPVIKKVVLTPDGSGGVEAHNTLVFPSMDVLGADMSGAIWDVGVWAEIGVFFPEEVQAMLDVTALEMGISEFVALPDDPFARFVIGGDYTFHNGIYLNGQFIHGFVHELGRDALHDYLVGGVEKKFRNETLKLTLAAALEVPDITDPGDDYAIVGMPEIAYYPWDGSEVKIGVHLIGGSGQTNFGQLTGMDDVYLAFKYAF